MMFVHSSEPGWQALRVRAAALQSAGVQEQSSVCQGKFGKVNTCKCAKLQVPRETGSPGNTIKDVLEKKKKSSCVKSFLCASTQKEDGHEDKSNKE